MDSLSHAILLTGFCQKLSPEAAKIVCVNSEDDLGAMNGPITLYPDHPRYSHTSFSPPLSILHDGQWENAYLMSWHFDLWKMIPPETASHSLEE